MSTEEIRTPSAILYLYDDPTDEMNYYYTYDTTPTEDGLTTAAQLALGGLIYAIRSGDILDHISDFLDAAEAAEEHQAVLDAIAAHNSGEEE